MPPDRRPAPRGRTAKAGSAGHCGPAGPIRLPEGVTADLTAVLAGNPNVGKSTLFNRLTGLDVLTAHYPGKTTDVNVGTTRLGARTIAVIDLPGVYGFSGSAEAQWVARRALFDSHPDVVIAVVDETNLARNLVLTIQLLETGLPMVVALNVHDEAERAGVAVDTVALTEALGVPAVCTVASTGSGVDEVMELAAAVADTGREGGLERMGLPPYGRWVEAAVAPVVAAVSAMPERPHGLGPRALALQLVEGVADLTRDVGEMTGGRTAVLAAEQARSAIESATGEGANLALTRERRSVATAVTERVASQRPARRDLARRLLDVTTSLTFGIPILAGALLAVFGFLFFVGEALATGFSALWAATASPAITSLVHGVAGTGLTGRVALWGLDTGIEASLSIGLPYILTFYVLLSVLEDSGYLGSVAFLADRAMHRLGLHGRAIVPLVAAAGCNVPAVIATGTMGTEKERRIAATLATMVPCSAQSAVILGAVAHYTGWAPAIGVFAVALAVAGLAGGLLNRTMRGYTGGLVMEMFPFRRPALGSVLRKSWGHFREFVTVATPIVILSSMVLGLLYETDAIWRLTSPLRPITVGLLGLPAVAGLTLLAGLVRKELALQLLVTLAIASGALGAAGAAARDLSVFMTPTNLFVYALVNTLAFPCVSTITVLWRQVGGRWAVATLACTVGVAVALGAVFARLLPALGWG